MNLIALHLTWPSVAAGTAEERYLPIPMAGTWRLIDAFFAPATAVAVDATNFTTITITQNDGAGGSDSSAVASFKTETTGGVALVLKTSLNLAITQRDDFTQGDQLKIAKTNGGTGAIIDGDFCFVFEKIN